MSRCAFLDAQRRKHDGRNPLLLAVVCAACLLAGTFLERHALTAVRAPDRALGSELAEGSYALVCRAPLCSGTERGATALVSTPAGPRLRKVAALPGDTASVLVVPAAGAACNPAQWNDREFDALFPLMLDELAPEDRDSLEIALRWTNEGETIETQTVPADRWPDRFEMRRQAEALASHRPGLDVKWVREIRLRGELLAEHVWKGDLYLFAPVNASYSQWLLPADSAKGRLVAAF